MRGWTRSGARFSTAVKPPAATHSPEITSCCAPSNGSCACSHGTRPRAGAPLCCQRWTARFAAGGYGSHRTLVGSPPGRARLHRPGARPDRRLLLAGAAAGHDRALGAHQQRGRMDHRDLLCRLHPRGPDPGHADRPRRRQAGLSWRRRHHGPRPPAVCLLCRWLLVGAHRARAHRCRLGRHLHDRPQAPRRQGRRQADVARGCRARGEHRHLRGAVLRLRPRYRRVGRLARGLFCRRRERGAGVAAGELGGAGRARRRPPNPIMRCSIFGRCCAIDRRWPMRSPIASTPWR